MFEDKFYGLLIGFLFGGLAGILLVSLATNNYGTIDDWSEPESLWRIQIDDVTLICDAKPKMKNSGIVLRYCGELYGENIKVKEWNSLSIERVE